MRNLTAVSLAAITLMSGCKEDVDSHDVEAAHETYQLAEDEPVVDAPVALEGVSELSVSSLSPGKVAVSFEMSPENAELASSYKIFAALAGDQKDLCAGHEPEVYEADVTSGNHVHVLTDLTAGLDYQVAVCVYDAVGRATGSTQFHTPVPHRVFVTSTTYNGGFGGKFFADEKCREHAAAAGLQGSWSAVLNSSAGHPSYFTNVYGNVVEAGNMVVAGDFDQFFFGDWSHSINYDEEGQVLGHGYWTGLNARAEDGETCDDWSSLNSHDLGGIGEYSAAFEQDASCAMVNGFLCIDGQE